MSQAKKHFDGVMWMDYRRHVGRAEACACNFEGADKSCNVGWALWAVVHQEPWDERKATR